MGIEWQPLLRLWYLTSVQGKCYYPTYYVFHMNEKQWQIEARVQILILYMQHFINNEQAF